MRILFVAPRYPNPPHRGDQVRVFHLVRCLAERHDVTLASFGSGPDLPFDGVRVLTIERGGPSSLAANLAAPRPGLPLQVRMFLDRRMSRLVAREADRPDLDVVHLTLARMAPYMPDPRPGLHRHLDLVDTLALNMRERARTERAGARAAFGFEARLMERYEARSIAQADSASVVSEADRQATGADGVSVIPNGVDAQSFPFREPQDGPPVITFFGNLGYFHNVEPARFLAESVFPLVRRQLPDARLRIVGARPGAGVTALGQLDGVEVAADVPDMSAELSRAQVAVLPMLSGSGIKNKVLEAFSAGVPVVTTPAGVAGIEGLEANTHCLVGEDATTLAAETTALLGSLDRRRRLAHAAAELVASRYSWERQADRLLAMYEGSICPG